MKKKLTKLKNYNMANPDITTGYAGESAGVYLSAALKQAKSLEGLTVYENIKFKRTLQVGSHTDALIAEAGCDFSASGTLALADKILEPKLLQVNVQLCKKDVLDDWQAAQMRAGANNSDFSSDFTAFVMSYLAGHIGQHVENNIWTGSGTGAHFNGFLTATSGVLTGDTTVLTETKTGAFSALNIIENMSKALQKSPDALFGSPNLRMYLGTAAYRFYLEAISTLGFAQLYNMNDDYSPLFNGVAIELCPGMPADHIVVAENTNLFFGTDLISDQTEIRMLDMANLDGSDNVRVVAKFSGSVQSGVGSDIVVLS